MEVIQNLLLHMWQLAAAAVQDLVFLVQLVALAAAAQETWFQAQVLQEQLVKVHQVETAEVTLQQAAAEAAVKMARV
tara:strand:+ start:165 stop:395 length:231 start_codon:yes stop_codon:yes gene_type:complete